jgi:hypothetical protein
MGIVGLFLAVLLVVGAIAVAAASAQAPEFQEQNKKTKEWVSLTKGRPFTQVGIELRRSSGNSALSCASSSGKGKLTGPKTLTLQTKYKGCEEPKTGVTCQSGKKAGEIKTSKLEGTLVLASSSAVEPPVVAVSMPGLGAYTCGGTTFDETGRALGAVTPVDTPTVELDVQFSEGAEPEPGCGKQELQLIEGLGPCVHLGVRAGSGPEEPAWTAAEKEWKPHGNVSVLK